MLARFVKSAAAPVLHWAGADSLLDRARRRRGLPLIVAYHRVVEDFESASRSRMPAMLISMRTLEHHLDWLGGRYRLISLDEIGAEMERGAGSRRPAAAVTFDDGYTDFHDLALPLLRRKGVPSALFVVTDLIGTTRAQAHDVMYALLDRLFECRPDPGPRLARLLADFDVTPSARASLAAAFAGPANATAALMSALPRAKLAKLFRAVAGEIGAEPPAEAPPGDRALGWETLLSVSRSGVVVGSHSRSHAILTNEDASTITIEAAESRRRLAESIGSPVRHFAYPAGRFDPAAASAVAAAGYEYAYTTCRHQDPARPLHTIPRVVLWERTCLDAFGRFSPSMMSCQVNRVFEITSGCRHERREAAIAHPAPLGEGPGEAL